MLKSLNLKWKLSIFITILAIIILSFISYITYNNTVNTVIDQINNRIELIKNYQKSSVNSIFAGLQDQIKQFTMNKDLFNFADMINYNIKDENDLKKVFNVYSFTVIDACKILNNQLEVVNSAEFALITNNKGIVVADSRLQEKKNMEQFIGRTLDKEKYSNKTPQKVFTEDGQNLLYIQQPFYKEEEVIGHYLLAVSLKELAGNFNQGKEGEGRLQILNENGIILNHANKDIIGQKTESEWILEKIKNGVQSAQTRRNNYYQIVEKLGDSQIYLNYMLSLKTINAPAIKIRNIVIIIALIGMIIIFISTYFLVNWQLTPLNRFLSAFDLMEEGDLREELKLKEADVKRNDEIGILSEGFNNMLIQLRGFIKQINSTSEKVDGVSEEINTMSSDVKKSSEQVTEAIKEVTEGAESQARNVEQINNKISNLDTEISQVSETNREMDDLAEEMMEATETGQVEIEKATEEMDEIKNSINEVADGIGKLNEISDEIDGILEIINNIAKQTNLLALNAAIEAARAGEAGRGFSVVADEIRSLAEESVSSAEKIGSLITEVKELTGEASNKMEMGNKKAEEGVRVVKSTEEAFYNIQAKIDQVVDKIKYSTGAIDNISSASKEIVENVENIAAISEQTSASAQQVSASSDEQLQTFEHMAAEVEKLLAMSGELNELVNNFRLE